jgi:hypothetical protein
MASPAAALYPSQGLLQDLLHLLSQPLTSVHCALELSLLEDQAQRAEEVAVALEQTDRVIEAVRLMREYLEGEEGHFVGQPFPLGLAIENALEQSSVLAEARGLRLFACGASTAAIPVRSVWLQRALFYLITLLVESEPETQAVAVLLEDGVSQSVISAHSLPASSSSDQSWDRSFKFTREAHTLRQVKLEIVRRVFESSGASLEFYSGSKAGFIIRLPRVHSRLSEIPA